MSNSIEKRISIHKGICEKMHNLYKTKNADYGDSFHITYEEFGFKSALIQIANKYQRLKSYDRLHKMTYESVEDTLMDLANYCLLTILELQSEKEKEKSLNGCSKT